MRRRMFVEFENWIFEQIADRRLAGCTGPDLISILLRSEVANEPLTPQQLLGYIRVLILAGNETTRNAATGGMIALLEHSEELDFLAEHRDEDEVIDTAVEEILRWTSPVIQFARVCTRDTEVNGQLIKAGEHVGIWHASANRDERQFVEPYRFDVQRSPNEHVAFGHGAHFVLALTWHVGSYEHSLKPFCPYSQICNSTVNWNESVTYTWARYNARWWSARHSINQKLKQPRFVPRLHVLWLSTVRMVAELPPLIAFEHPICPK